MAQKRRSFVAVFPAGSSGREDLRPPAAKVMKLLWKPPLRFPLFFDILFNVVVNNEHRADNNYHRDTHKYRRARQFLVIKRRERIIHEMLQHIERIRMSLIDTLNSTKDCEVTSNVCICRYSEQWHCRY